MEFEINISYVYQSSDVSIPVVISFFINSYCMLLLEVILLF